MSTPERKTMNTEPSFAHVCTCEQAVTEALSQEMRRDTRVLTFGEGVATGHPELVQEFGSQRVRNTPLAEGIIAGTAAGASAMGLRPVIDLLFAPFLAFAMDELINSAGKLRYVSGGQFSFPLVAMAKTGAGWCVGAQHNHNIEAWFVHAPGLKVVMPSNPADFKGLLAAAIRDDNPVIFFQDIGLLKQTGEVPTGEYVVPLGKAAVVRAGDDVTLVSYGKTVHHCLQAADVLAQRGIWAEVIDLRTLKPLESVMRTGCAVVVHEAAAPCGVGAEIAAMLADRAFAALRAPVIRVTGPDVPVPASYPLEQACVPQPDAIVSAVERQLAKRARSDLRAAG
jgi:pyruvate dehydrogenase E1 component beta subunit